MHHERGGTKHYHHHAMSRLQRIRMVARVPEIVSLPCVLYRDESTLRNSLVKLCKSLTYHKRAHTR